MARYEDLRPQVLRGLATGFGYALLLSQGLRAWRETCSRFLPPEPRRPTETFRCGEVLPVPAQAELVAVLANLFLGARR